MNIIFPDWYDDLFQIECESKGVVLNLEVIVNEKSYIFNFYDPTRFLQDVGQEISELGYFRDENAVIIKRVTKDNIIEYLSSI